jgi:hypothetical protein
MSQTTLTLGPQRRTWRGLRKDQRGRPQVVRCLNTSLQAYSNVEKPRYASEWQLRFQVQFLLPGFT